MTLVDQYKQILSEGSRGVKRLERKSIGIAKKMKRQSQIFPSTSDSVGHEAGAELVRRADETLAQIDRKKSSRIGRSQRAQVSSAIGDKPARVLDARLKSRTGKSLKDLASGHGDALQRAEEILTGDRTVKGSPMSYNIPLGKSEELRASGRFTVNRTPSDDALRAADERSAAGVKQRDTVRIMGGNRKQVNRRDRRQRAMASVISNMQKRGDDRESAANERLKNQLELKRMDMIARSDAAEKAMTIPQRIARAVRNIV